MITKKTAIKYAKSLKEYVDYLYEKCCYGGGCDSCKFTDRECDVARITDDSTVNLDTIINLENDND